MVLICEIDESLCEIAIFYTATYILPLAEVFKRCTYIHDYSVTTIASEKSDFQECFQRTHRIKAFLKSRFVT